MASSNTPDPITTMDPCEGVSPALRHLPLVESTDLFGDKREVQISHRGEIYRLRITAQQKLILTK